MSDGHEWTKHARDGWTVCARCGLVRNYSRGLLCKGALPKIEQRESSGMTAEEAIEAIRELARANRCGDGNCVYARPGGMATNGGCRCVLDDDGRRAARVYIGNVRNILTKVPA